MWKTRDGQNARVEIAETETGYCISLGTAGRNKGEKLKVENGGLGLSQFSSRVSILLLTRDIDIVILSVRLSVTRWYCMKTA